MVPCDVMDIVYFAEETNKYFFQKVGDAERIRSKVNSTKIKILTINS